MSTENPVVRVDLCSVLPVDEFVADSANAQEVVGLLRPDRTVDYGDDLAAATRVYLLAAVNPWNLAVESLGLTEDGTGIRMRVWRDEDRLGLRPTS